MSNDPMCEKVADDLAELALGSLPGRERIATLRHVESCAHCAHELEQLSRASDALLLVAPEVEPPLGFEVRLYDRMQGHEVRAARRSPKRWVLAGVAALVALAGGLGIGLSVGSGAAPHGAAKLSHTANLVENGTTIGEVSLYGGASPGLTMELDKSSVQGTVTCEIVTTDGIAHKVGTFTVANGYGAWAAPIAFQPKDVRTAELVSATGSKIAVARLG